MKPFPAKLINQLKEACGSYEPQFLFHGTNDASAEGIMKDGFSKRSTYWASPEIAAIYAKDKATMHGGQPVLLVIALKDLQAGSIHYDERAIEDPVGRSYAGVRRIWLDLGQWKGGWKAGFAASGCVEASAPPVQALRKLTTVDDLRDLLNEIQNPAPAKLMVTADAGLSL